MEQIHFWKTDIFATGQQFPRIQGDQYVNYSVL